MEGNLYAFTMILMLAGTIVALKITGMRPRLRSSFMGAAVALLLFFALAVLVPSHAWRRGEPLNAALLSALLSGVVVASIRRPMTCTVAVTTLAVAGLMLRLWGQELVHHQWYVGNRNWSQELDRVFAVPALQEASLDVRIVATDYPNAVLSEGWIEESLNQVAGQDVIPSPPSYRWGVVSSYWHTWLTGIYCIDLRRKGVWCSGGPIAECINKLEGRERR